MKNGYLIILGFIAIILSFATGPLGILISLTGLGIPPLWLQFILLAFAALVLVAFKQVLNVGFKYYASDKLLVYFLVLTILNFVIRNYNRALLVNKPLQFIGLLVFLFTPVLALLFYGSLFKLKNFWVRFYAIIGLLVSAIGIFEQATYIFLAYVMEPSRYATVAVISKMASGAFISYIKIFQNWLLGGMLIWGGFQKTKVLNKTSLGSAKPNKSRAR